MKIISLTEEQKSKFGYYVDKWVKIGLSTEPLDYEKARNAIEKVYRCGGLECPTIYFARSPIECVEIVKRMDSTLKSVDVVNEFCFGCNDAHWIGLYEFYRVECGLIEETECMEGLKEAAYHCGWFLPFYEACIVSERPKRILFDAQNRLHCDGGLAIEYSDGFGIYSFHGVQISDEMGSVHSSNWDSFWLLKYDNVEHRRILIQEIGYERILKEIGGKVVHRDGDMELIKIIGDVDVEPIVLLKVVCPSTEKEYILRVSPDSKTCESARRSTLERFPSNEYDSLNFLMET